MPFNFAGRAGTDKKSLPRYEKTMYELAVTFIGRDTNSSSAGHPLFSY